MSYQNATMNFSKAKTCQSVLVLPVILRSLKTVRCRVRKRSASPKVHEEKDIKRSARRRDKKQRMSSSQPRVDWLRWHFLAKFIR
jgi:hypothetical protein